jgi:hypothetical protein
MVVSDLRQRTRRIVRQQCKHQGYKRERDESYADELDRVVRGAQIPELARADHR